MDTLNNDFTNDFAKWQSISAFNTYWQYSYVNRASFYANIEGEYKNYMQKWVENFLWWYDGWVPYFHNQNQGIFSTKLAASLVNGVSDKIVSGRLFFKNKNTEVNLKKDENGQYKINKALSFISSKWSSDSDFEKEIKKAITFCAAAGSSLIKLDKTCGELKAKALRFDSFYPTVGFNGEIIDITCFLRNFTNLSQQGKNERYKSYFVVEHRYYGDYTRADGEILYHVPIVEYKVKESEGTITNSLDYDATTGDIPFCKIPRNTRKRIAKAFDGIMFEQPILLPFADLGCELLNFTECVSALPELPFGESFLTNIMPYLQSYDYYWSAFNTDMYLGRGRVLMPKPFRSAMAQKDGEYNAGLDSFIYTQYQENPATDKPSSPMPLQFDLRASQWSEIRTTILQNIAINTRLNLSSIASFLNDSKGTKTAREISTEESETALFVDNKRALLEKPINRILKTVTTYYGYADDVVIRWSAAGLTNKYTRAEMIATGLQNKFMSLDKAVKMFNEDDDEYQIQDEIERIKNEQEKQQDFGFGDLDKYLGGGNGNSEKTAELSGDETNASGNGNPFDSQG